MLNRQLIKTTERCAPPAADKGAAGNAHRECSNKQPAAGNTWRERTAGEDFSGIISIVLFFSMGNSNTRQQVYRYTPFREGLSGCAVTAFVNIARFRAWRCLTAARQYYLTRPGRMTYSNRLVTGNRAATAPVRLRR
jgi:hypothetical protein